MSGSGANGGVPTSKLQDHNKQKTIDPAAGASASSTNPPPPAMLEEDDEFEDFPVEGASPISPIFLEILYRSDLVD